MMFLRRTGSGGAVLMVMCGRDGAFWYGADAARHRRTSSSGAIFMRGPEGSGAENKSVFTVQMTAMKWRKFPAAQSRKWLN